MSVPESPTTNQESSVGSRVEWWENPPTMRKRTVGVLTAILFLGVLIFALPLRRQHAAEQETFRYVILSAGHAAGNEVDTFGPGGRIDSTFEFNDRGRGPKITAHYLLGADGFPQRTDITGNDYLKAPVDEHFTVENAKAHWKSTSEDGSASAGGFYVSANGAGAEAAMLVAALVHANGKALKLLPAGEARLEKLTETTLEDHGQKIHVVEYAVTGLSFTPQAVWLDDNLRLFAFPGKWLATMREGWEGTHEKLYALQQKAEEERYARLARELAKKPDHPVAFEHVRLFDSERAAMREDVTVVVDGQKIS